MRAGYEPNYKEAYPQLDILKATAAALQGQNLCFFRDEEGRILGSLRFTPLDGGRVAILTGALSGRYFPIWKRPMRIPLLASGNDSPGTRRATACPWCERRVQILVCKGDWACTSCHGLLFRGQVVDRPTRAYEELQALEARLMVGRPKGMHQRKYHAQREADLARAAELRESLRGKGPRVASDAHLHRIDAEWISEEDKLKRREFDGF